MACNTCGRAAGSPFRVYDARGKAVSGCVDGFHTDSLAGIIGESSRWHGRKEAKAIRATSAARLKALGRATKKNPVSLARAKARTQALDKAFRRRIGARSGMHSRADRDKFGAIKAALDRAWRVRGEAKKNPRAPRLSLKFGNRSIALLRAAERRRRTRGASAGAESMRAGIRAGKVAQRYARVGNPSGAGLKAHRARARVGALRTAERRLGEYGWPSVRGAGKRPLKTSPGARMMAISEARKRAQTIARGALRARRLDLREAIDRLERVGAEFPRTEGAIARARRLRALKRAYDRRIRVNPRGTMAKRKRNRLGHFVKAAARHVRRARDRFGHFVAGTKPRKKKSRRVSPRKRKTAARKRRNPARGATMSRALVANPRKRRGRKRRAASGQFTKRRRSRRVTNPRRRRHHARRRNPGMSGGLMKSAMSSLVPMGLGGIGGAVAGFADAKFLSDKPVVSAVSKVVMGALGCALLRKRPALAFGWAGGVMGSFGYSMGVKAAGGLVAHSPAAALKGIADMAADDPAMAALLEGLGSLEPNDGVLGDVGDMAESDIGSVNYAQALADTDEDNVGDLVEAQ